MWWSLRDGITMSCEDGAERLCGGDVKIWPCDACRAWAARMWPPTFRLDGTTIVPYNAGFWFCARDRAACCAFRFGCAPDNSLVDAEGRGL